MFLKYIFDRLMAAEGLLVLWPVLVVVAFLIKDEEFIFNHSKFEIYDKKE